MVIFRGPQKYFLGVVCTYVDAFYAGIQKPKSLLYLYIKKKRLLLHSLGPLGGHFPLWRDLTIFRLDFLRSAVPTMGKKADVKKIGKRTLYIFPALYILILSHFTPVLKKKEEIPLAH